MIIESRGDGTDLCCMIHPFGICVKCKLTVCLEHWGDEVRREQGLLSLSMSTLNREIGIAICPECSVGMCQLEYSKDFIPKDFKVK